MRRALRGLSTVMIVAGALLLADAGLTLAWQEPLSAVYAKLNQDKLAGQLRELERAVPSPVELRALAELRAPSRRFAFLARSLRRKVEVGDAIGRVKLPSIGVDWLMVQGTTTGSLRKGPGHYPDTPLPGQRGTVAVAGHRTTYLAPFRRLDDVRRGDPAILDLPYGRFTYRVTGTKIVPADAVWVTRSVGYDQVVLTACHPLYSASQRIVVFARLVRAEPLGQALAAG